MMDPLREFYKTHLPDLSVITDLRFRHFRIRLRDGSFLKADRKMLSGEALREWLARRRPSDVYYSTGCWLNPQLLGPRSDDDTLSNLFIRGDLAFDVDEKPFNIRNIEKARVETVDLYERLVAMGKKVKYIAFSGGKGFHIVCQDDWVCREEDPHLREADAISRRRVLVGELRSYGLKFDEKITVDTRRILRVPGTVNASTGYVCTVLTESQLIGDSAGKMLKYVPRISPYASLTSRIWDDQLLKQIRTIWGWKRRRGARPHPNEYRESYLSSSIPGTMRQIAIFNFPLPRAGKLEGMTDMLKSVQSTYSLGDVFMFATDDDFYAVSLRTMDVPRIIKALKAAGSRNLQTLLRYKQTFMRVGVRRGLDGAEFGNMLSYKGFLDGGGRDYFVSRPHHMFLLENGVPLPAYPRMHGKREVVLTHALIE